jgi:O-antigen biosynthesis protein WbqP
MLRLFDFILSLAGIILGFPLLAIIYILTFFDTGLPLFRQVRVGRYQKPFTLIKFRTMRPDTQSVPSHFVDESAITTLGMFLRRTKLDELPQLWNVFFGHMSLVGPRPCLYSQTELIEERERKGVFKSRPGITGLAQINKIDMSTPKRLAETDADMLRNLTPFLYFQYILATVIGKGSGDVIRK